MVFNIFMELNYKTMFNQIKGDNMLLETNNKSNKKHMTHGYLIINVSNLEI